MAEAERNTQFFRKPLCNPSYSNVFIAPRIAPTRVVWRNPGAISPQKPALRSP